jgi:methylated-DNA-[protein]-cysteine S-methyltransferase
MPARPRAGEGLASLTVDSPFGPLVVACSERGLTRVTLPNERPSNGRSAAGTLGADATTFARSGPASCHAAHAAAELWAYFAGTLHEFTVPLDLRGTPFQLAVWQAVLAVPFGETRSYAAIAAAIGRPDAVRAVGAANGANPAPVIVPCHRILGSDGSLTGYGGGLAMKRGLLEHERRVLSLDHPCAERHGGRAAAVCAPFRGER